MDPQSSVITLTFGDSAENHVGMEMLGQRVNEGEGFTFDDLKQIQSRFRAQRAESYLYQLHDADKPEAYVLVIKRGVDFLLAPHTWQEMFQEQAQLNVDKKALMRGQVKNKLARWNLCFDSYNQEPNYAEGKGRIIAYDDVPLTKRAYERFEEFFGPKARELKGEGNYYFDLSKCGIGYHGDSERRKVIAIRLGAPLPIYYCWFQEGEPISDRFVLPLDGGDIYVMSEKAVGCDWKRRKIPTLRHATGCDKYVTL